MVDNRGSSLIGLLMVLMILGLMAGLVYASVGGLSGGSSPLPGLPGAGSTTTTTPGRGGGTSQIPIASAAAIAACESDVQSISTALGAANAVAGVYPTTVDALVRSGFLRQAPVLQGYTFSLQTLDGVGTGVVLVNGTHGASGCGR